MKTEVTQKLDILISECRSNIDIENGNFDELAQKVFTILLDIEPLRECDSNEIMIQLDKSVWDEYLQLNIDAVLYNIHKEICFSTSDADTYVYTTDFRDVPRVTIMKCIDTIVVNL